MIVNEETPMKKPRPKRKATFQIGAARSRGSASAKQVTEMEDLRTRNKVNSAKRTASQDRGAENGSLGDSGEQRALTGSMLKETSQQAEAIKKSEKLLRQRKNEKFRCIFTAAEGVQVAFNASCKLTVTEIKETLLKKAKSALPSSDEEKVEEKEEEKKEEEAEKKEQEAGEPSSPKADANGLLDGSGYVMRVVGIDEYILNESLPLQRVDFIQVCTKAFITPQLEMVAKADVGTLDEEGRKARIKSELQLGTEIAVLVGSSQLTNFLQYENAEIADFRRCAIRLKLQEMEKRQERIKQAGGISANVDPRVQVLPEYLIGEPMPLIVPEMFKIVAHFPGDMSGTVSARPVDRADQLQVTIFNKYIRTVGAEQAAGKKVEQYVLKVTGFKEYLYGQSQLIAYDFIRKAISKAELIEISLVPIADIEDLLSDLSATYSSIVDDLLALEETTNDKSNLISLSECNDPFKITINSVERALPSSDMAEEDTYLFICAELYHAGHKLGEGFTMAVPSCSDPQWNETITFETTACKNIPLGCRVLLTLYFRKCDPASAWLKQVDPKTDTPLSWVATQVIDHQRKMKHGLADFRMWKGKADPIGTCCQNLLQMNAPILFTEFSGTSEGQTLYYPPVAAPEPNTNPIHTNDKTKEKLDKIIRADPLTDLKMEDKMILWGNRMYISTIPSALPKFLLSVRWDDCMQVQEAHRMLYLWTKPQPLQALELLDAKFADPTVRSYGITCLEYMPDGECYDFMLQLTQVLKHEPYHNSALAMFLLERAWNNPKIGHSLVWFLKAEMHLEDVAERYTLLLESYLRGAGTHRTQLFKQHEATQSLVGVAMKVKQAANSTERKKVLMESLSKLKFDSEFELPLDQRMVVKELMVEKCKYMDSKKLPLWLVWKNAESIGKPILVIFKVGDDLRQDVLTLQVIRIFDKLWKNEGLDLLLQPYGCIATGDEIGMIEVVKNADTTANINKAAGGTKAVLRQDTLTKWLKKHNPTPEQWEKAQETFLLSCAGYCVATFVLGIGDRHNDNIMVTRDGHLFHIDFGHFLGNYKKKYGIKRERAPFVFTPQYAHVLGGKNSDVFNKFVETCCVAFNILRRNSDMFITLFQMMLCTGIPELGSEQDIEYLRYAFAVGTTEEEAEQYYKKLIYSSLNTKTTIINDVLHVWIHDK
mmetsp:Transcript_419/g.1446  ORF Transcript_419/g.1446 Transcript_419/m.1446 type:complete len:1166 (-) Transcript_419:175-3672(-)